MYWFQGLGTEGGLLHQGAEARSQAGTQVGYVTLDKEEAPETRPHSAPVPALLQE